MFKYNVTFLMIFLGEFKNNKESTNCGIFASSNIKMTI